MQLTLLKDGSTHQSQINDQIRFTNAITDLSDDSYKSHVIIDSYKTAKTFKLIDSIKTLYEMDNAGGASAQYSEYLSGVVYSGFGAHSFIEEMAVPYWFNYKKVDYLCSIYGQRIGISVKRAVNREIMLQLKELKRKDARNLTDATFTRTEADRFLDSAIRGLIVARRCVFQDHDFSKSILHIWCPSKRIACLIKEAFEAFDVEDMDSEVKGYLILHLTVCYDKYLYIGR